MYTVKILPEAEFDKLPYKRAKTSLGLADPKTNMAFVRDTGYNDITKMTIGHELDEMISKTSPHEEDGIRYKSLGQIGGNIFGGIKKGAQSLGNFLTPGPEIFGTKAAAPGTSIPGISPMQAYKPLSGAEANPFEGFNRATALSNASQSAPNLVGNLNQPGGAFGKALSSFTNALAPSVADFGRSALENFSSAGIPSVTGMSSVAPSITELISGTSGDAGPTRPILQSGTPTGSPGTPAASGGATPSTATGTDKGVFKTVADYFTQPRKVGGEQSILDRVFEAAPGLAVSALGNFFAPEVEAPDFSGITGRLEDRVTGDIASPYRELGAGELQRIIETPAQTPPETAFTMGDIYNDEQLQKDLQNFDNYWKRIRPGADYQNDSEYQAQRAEIIERARERRTAARDELTFQYQMQQEQQKYNAAKDLLNLDDAQMRYYMQIAQLEIAQIMAQLGLDAGRAQQIKELFGNMGRLLIPQQTVVPTQSTTPTTGAA